MMRRVSSFLAALASCAQPVMAQQARETITIAYFLEWPMPYGFAKVEAMYEARMGVEIDWVAFDSGTAITEVMATGDVDIGVSLGAATFVKAVSNGIDIVAVDIATSYAGNQNCVVSSALGVTAENAGQILPGRSVAFPVGTATHFGFLQLMDHLGVDTTSMQFVDATASEAAAELAQGNVDMACGWGGPLRRMLEFGNILLTGAEKEANGILVFDVNVVTRDFLEEQPELVASFLGVTHEVNALWNSGQMRDEMIPLMALDAGLPLDDAVPHMETLVFPSIDDQLSNRWLGGAVAAYFAGVAEVFVEAGQLEAALPAYQSVIDARPLALGPVWNRR